MASSYAASLASLALYMQLEDRHKMNPPTMAFTQKTSKVRDTLIRYLVPARLAQRFNLFTYEDSVEGGPEELISLLLSDVVQIKTSLVSEEHLVSSGDHHGSNSIENNAHEAKEAAEGAAR